MDQVGAIVRKLCIIDGLHFEVKWTASMTLTWILLDGMY